MIFSYPCGLESCKMTDVVRFQSCFVTVSTGLSGEIKRQSYRKEKKYDEKGSCVSLSGFNPLFF